MLGIYMIENTINHKRYIGKTIDFNRRTYLHTHLLDSGIHANKHLQNAWNKYGSENFKFILFDNRTEEFSKFSISEINRQLNDLEIAWIKFYKSSNEKYGYNLSEGGDGAILLGNRNGSYGKPKSKSVRLKISQTILANKSHSGERNGRYGKPVSMETRQKISASNRGRIQSDEERKMRSEAMRRANQLPENIAKREARKNDPIRHQQYIEIGKRNRKYTDEFVAKIRSEYSDDRDIKVISEKYCLRYKLVMEIVHRNGHFKYR